MTPSPPHHRTSRLLGPPALLATTYLLLGLAWVLANPAGGAPDETSHLLKALAVSGGEPAGDRVLLPSAPTDAKKDAWVKRTARKVDVPPGLSPTGLDCNAGDPRRSAACQYDVRPPRGPSASLSTVGTAQPTTYLVPGLLARLAGSPATAIRLGRLASGVLSLGLIWVAALLLWDRSVGMASLAGLMVTVTPMVVFLASSLSPSGPEVASGICFFSALLRVTRGPTPRAWPWAALGVSGAVLAASRTLGPVWVTIDVAVVALANGLRPSAQFLRAAGARARWALVVVTMGLVLGVGWEVVVQPHGSLEPEALRGALRPSLNGLHNVLGELIGVFGSLDSVMPAFAYVLWWAVLAVLGLGALRLGRWRERLVLLLLMAGAVPLVLAIAALNLAQTGFGMQGRYVLPVLVAVPLLAGEVVTRRWPDRAPWRLQRLVLALPPVIGGVQAVAWYANARRSAVGIDGSWLFVGSSEWAPPMGWYPVIGVVGLAVAAVVAVAVVSSGQDPALTGDESLR